MHAHKEMGARWRQIAPASLEATRRTPALCMYSSAGPCDRCSPGLSAQPAPTVGHTNVPLRTCDERERRASSACIPRRRRPQHGRAREGAPAYHRVHHRRLVPATHREGRPMSMHAETRPAPARTCPNRRVGPPTSNARSCRRLRPLPRGSHRRRAHARPDGAHSPVIQGEQSRGSRMQSRGEGARRRPLACAMSAAMRISRAEKALAAGLLPAVRTPPVAITLTQSTQLPIWRATTARISESVPAPPPHWWQWPAGLVRGWPAHSKRGPEHSPRTMLSRSSSAAPLPGLPSGRGWAFCVDPGGSQAAIKPDGGCAYRQGHGR